MLWKTYIVYSETVDEKCKFSALPKSTYMFGEFHHLYINQGIPCKIYEIYGNENGNFSLHIVV